jgi:hypothetical protein
MDTAYTDAMNLTNYTAVVIPTIRADKKIDVFDEGYEPLGDMDRKNWQACESLGITSHLMLHYPAFGEDNFG